MKKARFITSLRVLELLVLTLTGLGVVLVFKQDFQPVFMGLLLGLLIFLSAIIMVETRWLSPQAPVKGNVTDKLASLFEGLPDTLTRAMQPQSELIHQELTALKQARESADTLIRNQSGALAQFKSSFEKSINIVTNSLQQTAAEFSAVAGSLTEKTDVILQTMPEMINGFRSQAAAMLTEAAESAKSLGQSLTTGQAAQTETLSESLAKGIKTAADVQQQAIVALTSQIGESAEQLNRAVDALEESGNLIHVNQAGLQSGIEMLNNGLAQILEQFQASSQRPKEEGAFIERLHQTLEAFHEKATEILIDTAQKTREILVKEA